MSIVYKSMVLYCHCNSNERKHKYDLYGLNRIGIWNPTVPKLKPKGKNTPMNIHGEPAESLPLPYPNLSDPHENH
jgi:hypothetical protein